MGGRRQQLEEQYEIMRVKREQAVQLQGSGCQQKVFGYGKALLAHGEPNPGKSVSDIKVAVRLKCQYAQSGSTVNTWPMF